MIQWPDDRITVLIDVPIDQTLTLYQKDAKSVSHLKDDSNKSEGASFQDISEEGNINFTHVENDFDDFRRDGLIYHMMSTEGPRMCKGDVNGDGLEDLYVGGAKDQPGTLLIQKENGAFISSNQDLLARG